MNDWSPSFHWSLPCPSNAKCQATQRTILIFKSLVWLDQVSKQQGSDSAISQNRRRRLYSFGNPVSYCIEYTEYTYIIELVSAATDVASWPIPRFRLNRSLRLSTEEVLPKPGWKYTRVIRTNNMQKSRLLTIFRVCLSLIFTLRDLLF